MATFTSPFTNNSSEQIGSKNLGLHFNNASVGTIQDISSVTIKTTNSPSSSTLGCYVQTSVGVSQIGSNLSNPAAGTHTFTAGTPVPVNTDNFIIFLYQSSGSAINVGAQHNDAPSVSGVNLEYYSPQTGSPTFGSWLDVTWNTPNGMYMDFTYTPGASASGARLPPPPLVVHF